MTDHPTCETCKAWKQPTEKETHGKCRRHAACISDHSVSWCVKDHWCLEHVTKKEVPQELMNTFKLMWEEMCRKTHYDRARKAMGAIDKEASFTGGVDWAMNELRETLYSFGRDSE